MDVLVTAVRSRRDRRDFAALPWRLYQGDPKWVPPIQGQVEQLVGWRRHAFYEHAESQAFVARRNGEVVGRILAIVNHAHIRLHQEQVGFFGFFETVDDPDVAGSLLDAARQWLKNRRIERVLGPVNPSLNHECGLLVEGFDTEPYFMTPYNPPYYKRLLKLSDCRKAKDLVAYIFFAEDIPRILSQYRKQWELDKQSSGITIRTYTRKSFEHDLRMFLDLHNEALAGLWNTVPMSEAEIRDLVATLRWLLVPELAAIVERHGEPIGTVLALLDYNPLLRRIGGRLFPLGFVQLIRRRQQIKRARLISMHVAKDFQDAGIGGTLLSALLPAFQKWKFEEFEVSWTLEDNKRARQSLETAGGQLYKRFRIYEYA